MDSKMINVPYTGVNHFRMLSRMQYGPAVAKQSPIYYSVPIVVDAPPAEPEPIERRVPARLVHYFDNRFGISLANNLAVHFDTTLDNPERWVQVIEYGWVFELYTRHEYEKDEGRYKLVDIKIEASAW